MAELYTSGAYAENYPSWHAEDSGWKAENIIRILRRNHVSPKNIVDVGCGAGGILTALIEEYSFASAVGFDISPVAIDMAKKNAMPGLSFHTGDFLKEGGSGYDLLLCIDVFEHVADYLGFLKSLRSRAELFVFHIPLDMNIKGLLRGHHMTEREHTGHLHYFDYQTAAATLTDSGYRIVDRFYTYYATYEENPSLVTKAITVIRNGLGFLTGEDVAVQLLGGASLMVLAEGGP